MLELVARIVALLLAAAVVVTTVLPMWSSPRWWVRAWDFPRPQIALAALLALVLALWAFGGPARIGFCVAMAACCVYQIARILPYTPLWPTEMTLGGDAAAEGAVTIFAANVLMENDKYDLIREAVEATDPDILLLMETDQGWVDAMAPVLDRYATVVRHPLDNHYGMVFATRLEAREAKAVRLTQDRTPSLFSELVDARGTVFRFVGLHPRPPVPGQTSQERDAQILYAARFARRDDLPLVAVGDFNDVAWSDTTRRFKRVGDYLDPRIGRGFYASFDANKPYMRFPIDQFYVTENVVVVSLKRGDYVGSDHYPLIARVKVDADIARRLNGAPKAISDVERQAIDGAVETYRQSLGDDNL